MYEDLLEVPLAQQLVEVTKHSEEDIDISHGRSERMGSRLCTSFKLLIDAR